MAGLKRVGSSLSLASPHKVVTPLDWPCVLAIQCTSMISILSTTYVFSTAVFMVRAWGATDEAKAAAHAGLMIAAKPAFSAISSYWWGSAGDRLGFRGTLLVSSMVTAWLTAALGLVTSFPAAVAVRALSGLFDGVMTLTRSSMAKISDKTNSAKAFSTFGVTYGLGSTVGPTLSAVLAFEAHTPPPPTTTSGESARRRAAETARLEDELADARRRVGELESHARMEMELREMVMDEKARAVAEMEEAKAALEKAEAARETLLGSLDEVRGSLEAHDVARRSAVARASQTLETRTDAAMDAVAKSSRLEAQLTDAEERLAATEASSSRRVAEALARGNATETRLKARLAEAEEAATANALAKDAAEDAAASDRRAREHAEAAKRRVAAEAEALRRELDEAEARVAAAADAEDRHKAALARAEEEHSRASLREDLPAHSRFARSASRPSTRPGNNPARLLEAPGVDVCSSSWAAPPSPRRRRRRRFLRSRARVDPRRARAR